VAEIEHSGGQGCRGEGSSTAWQGKLRGGLDTRGAIGMGVESQIVGRDHWRVIGRGWPDAIKNRKASMQYQNDRLENISDLAKTT
jgi:hypothetical protein